jgi:hypothetical protein
MRITEQTTDEEIFAPIAVAKKRLVEIGTQCVESPVTVGEGLVDLALKVACAEAVAQVQSQYRGFVTGGADATVRLIWLARLGLRSDDGWSGRKNDMRRSCADAVKNWIAEEIDAIRFDEKH